MTNQNRSSWSGQLAFVLAAAATVAVSLLTKKPAPEITVEFDTVANG